MTKIKICGLADPEMAVETAAFGADLIGLVFAKSRRQITPQQAQKICQSLPTTVEKVGVFVSPTYTELTEIVDSVPLDLIQIHGDLPAELPDLPVIRATSLIEGRLPAKIKTERFDYLLLDAPPQEFIGGNGITFDWQATDFTELANYRVIIAGGLNAANVTSAINYFHPYAVDVSSGVETQGQKDLAKIQQFIHAVKEGR